MKTKKVIIAAFLVFSLLSVSLFMGMGNKVTYAAMDEDFISDDYYLIEPINDELNPFIAYGEDILSTTTENHSYEIEQYDGIKIPISEKIVTTYSLIYEMRTNTEDFYLTQFGPIWEVVNDESFRFTVSHSSSFSHTDYLEHVETWARSEGQEAEFGGGIEYGTVVKAKFETKVKFTYNNSRGGSDTEAYSDTTSYAITFDQEIQPPFGPGIYTFQLRGKVREYRLMLRKTVEVTFKRGFSKPTVTTSYQDSEQERFRVVENLPTLTDNPYLSLRKIANLAI